MIPTRGVGSSTAPAQMDCSLKPRGCPELSFWRPTCSCVLTRLGSKAVGVTAGVACGCCNRAPTARRAERVRPAAEALGVLLPIPRWRRAQRAALTRNADLAADNPLCTETSKASTPTAAFGSMLSHLEGAHSSSGVSKLIAVAGGETSHAGLAGASIGPATQHRTVARRALVFRKPYLCFGAKARPAVAKQSNRHPGRKLPDEIAAAP